MPALELLLGSFFTAAAKAAVEHGPGLVTDISKSVLEDLVKDGLKHAWKGIQNRSANDPVNVDLQRATRRAYLRATLDLAEQAGERAMPGLIKSEIKALENWIPEQPLAAIDTWLSDEYTPDGRQQAFRRGALEWLATDLDRWQPAWRATIERYAQDGWERNGAYQDWRGLMALYFAEEIKTNPRARDVFYAEMLVSIRNAEPRLAAQIDAFWKSTDEKLDKLDRKSDKLLELVAKTLPPPTRSWNRLDPRQPGIVARRKLLDWLRDKVSPSGVLLSGEPGTGKSTLAREFGWEAWERGEHPIVVEQLCGLDEQGNIRPLEKVGTELAAKLPIHDPQQPPEKQVAAARDWLRDHEALLILDDVWDAAVCALVPGPPAQVVFTSRHPSLSDLPDGVIRAVGGFEPEETEQLVEQRLPGWLSSHRDMLLGFARRLEHLPYALAIAADLLRRDRRPRETAITALRTQTLVNGKLDLPKLLRTAVAMHTEGEKALLAAVALCSVDGVWLPLAGEMAGLSEDAMWTAAMQLADTSLLRTLDRETSRFSVHMALRDIMLADLDGELRRRMETARADALLRRLKAWREDRRKWHDPARCVGEVGAAVVHLAEDKDWDRYIPLFNMGWQHAYHTGSLPEARRILLHQEQVCQELGDRAWLQASYGYQALILKAWGRLEEAMVLLKQEEAICEELGDLAGLQRSYGHQALILQDWGRLEEAMVLLKQQEAIRQELGDRSGLRLGYGNQGLILKAWGRLEEAMVLLKQEEAICHELGDRSGLQRSYGNQAGILSSWGRLEEAMALLKQQEVICQKLGDRAGLQASYGNQALILQAWGRLEEAMALHKQEETICRELGDRAGLQRTSGNQAVILKAWGRLEEAMALHQQQEAICQELGYRAGLQASYGNQALILQDLGRLEEAMALHQQQEAICLELGDRVGLQSSYGGQALILQAWGRLEEAMALHQQQEAICLELGDRAGLQRSYGNEALILKAWGRPEEAMALLKQQEAICQALGNRDGLARSLVNQGLLHRDQNHPEQARTLLTHALQIFTELGMPRERDLVQGLLNQL